MKDFSDLTDEKLARLIRELDSDNSIQRELIIEMSVRMFLNAQKLLKEISRDV